MITRLSQNLNIVAIPITSGKQRNSPWSTAIITACPSPPPKKETHSGTPTIRICQKITSLIIVYMRPKTFDKRNGICAGNSYHEKFENSPKITS